MSDQIEQAIKSSQDQALAAWVTQLNQARLNELFQALSMQDINLENALSVISQMKTTVNDVLIASNRGGANGLHGFIAEVTECSFGNARALLEGSDGPYTWINDNGPVDFLRNGVDIQQKFVQSGGHYGLEAIKRHLSDYPDFIKNGGKYQIPKDFYEAVKRVADMSEEEINKLSSAAEDGLSRAKALWIREFLETSGVSMDDIEPSLVEYADVQKGTINETISDEEKRLRERDQEKRDEAYGNAKPSLQEGLKVTAVGAAVEGGVAFCMTVAKKRREGKKLSEFTESDWKEIGLASGQGAVKGGVRGGAIYAMSNFTATPTNVASAYVTAAFGVAAQVKALEQGRVSKEDFVINCEAVCMDASISAIASLAGQMLIPIPVVGALIGNITGELIKEICKNIGEKKSQETIAHYHAELETLNRQLEQKYLAFLVQVKKEMEKYTSLEQLAFDENRNKAFWASIELAYCVGVPENQVLKTESEIDRYFLS